MSSTEQATGVEEGTWYATGLKTLRAIAGCCGLVVAALGIYLLNQSGLNPKSVIHALYQILFGVMIIVCELRIESVLKYAKFLTHFLGLGLYYLFVAGLALGSTWYEYVTAIALLVVAIVYMSLGCCCRTMSKSGFEHAPRRSSASKPRSSSQLESQREQPAAIKDLQKSLGHKAIDYAVDNPEKASAFVGAYPK